MTAEMPATKNPATGPRVRDLALLSLPAILTGMVCAVMLVVLDETSGWLQSVIWTALPHSLGIDSASGWWIFGVLSTIGLLVGVALWLVPGHGGPDSATTELVSAPLRLRPLPGLALVVILGLAGGVSLGPENPIIAINTALVVAIMTRFWAKVPVPLSIMMAAAATIGAMFGTPVAAALILSNAVAAAGGAGALWDRLFLPLVAAAAASVTTVLITGRASMGMAMPAYATPQALDLLTGSVVACAAAGITIAGVFIFPRLHRLFHSLKHPVLYVTAGGIVLGALGALGGPLTLFKGLDQMAQLAAHRSEYNAGQFALFALVKLAALLVAAAAGFRGGRIFPAVFIGVALGLLGSALIPALPVTLAVACGVLGVTLVVARDGWLALFMGAVIVGDVSVLPMLCIIVLPVWLMVTKAPEMLVHSPGMEDQAAASSG